MKRFLGLLLALSVCHSSPATAEGPHSDSQDQVGSKHSTEPSALSTGSGRDSLLELGSPARDRLIIQVNGIVCSFCAHGLEKGLSKLSDLDESEYGNGVLVDIESQFVTLAFQPDSEFPFAEVHKRIKKAGYDPVRFDFRISGALVQVGSNWEIVGSNTGNRFQLAKDEASGGRYVTGSDVEIAVSLEASLALSLKAADAIPVQIYVGP